MALASEDLGTGTEAFIAFDGSLLWPALQESTHGAVLLVSPVEGRSREYANEVGGELLRSMLRGEHVLPVAKGGFAAAAQRIIEVGARCVAVALDGERLSRAAAERAAERALREAGVQASIILSSEVGPLWGWADRPVEKAAVCAGLLPLVEDAAIAAREGLSDVTLPVWFSSLDGTLVPLSLARRQPYAVLRGLPILSLSAAIAFGRELSDARALTAVSVHETSTALARVPAKPAVSASSGSLLGAHFESLGIGASSLVGFDGRQVRVGSGVGIKRAVTVREVLEAAGILWPSKPKAGAEAAADLAGWMETSPDAAVGRALAAIFDAFRRELHPRLREAAGTAFAGPLAGAIAGEAVRGLDGITAFVLPSFGASAALAARSAPRASRAAELVGPAAEGSGPAEAERALDELLALACGDLEECGLSRESLAAVTWIEGSRGAHGIYPALDRAAIAKAAELLAADMPKEGGAIVQVEVYPARSDSTARFVPGNAPIASRPDQLVVLPGEGKSLTVRVSPAGALAHGPPLPGPAVLADPTGLIFVPEGFEASAASAQGVALRPR